MIPTYRLNRAVALFSVAVAGLLSGCATYQWEKPGATQADFNRDNYECQTEAARTYPTTVVQVPISSGYTMPSNTSCTTHGTAYGSGNTVYGNSNTDCTTTPGQTVAPATVPIDENANNRSNAFHNCLVARGWSLVRVDQQTAQSDPWAERSAYCHAHNPQHIDACIRGLSN